MSERSRQICPSVYKVTQWCSVLSWWNFSQEPPNNINIQLTSQSAIRGQTYTSVRLPLSTSHHFSHHVIISLYLQIPSRVNNIKNITTQLTSHSAIHIQDFSLYLHITSILLYTWWSHHSFCVFLCTTYKSFPECPSSPHMLFSLPSLPPFHPFFWVHVLIGHLHFVSPSPGFLSHLTFTTFRQMQRILEILCLIQNLLTLHCTILVMWPHISTPIG